LLRYFSQRLDDVVAEFDSKWAFSCRNIPLNYQNIQVFFNNAEVLMEKSAFVHDYLSYLLGQANVSLYRALAPEVKAHGLISLEWRVLATLLDHPGGLHITALAREVLENHSTVNKAVRRMEASGLVRTAPAAEDARRVTVRLASAGAKPARRLVQIAREQETRLLAAYTPTQIAKFKTMLRDLARQGQG
jgi:MarR family transcriptional regulator, organic hydroperoxide resistance regulator